MAVRCSGTQRLHRTANLPGSTSVTICGWAQSISHSGAFECLASVAAAASSPGNAMELGLNSAGNLFVTTYSGGSDSTVFSFNEGEPFFWAMSNNGTGGSGCVGYARPFGTNTLLSATATGMSFTTAAVGVADNGWTERFNGRVWNVKCWDRVLTAAELLVVSYYRRPLFPASLNFWWPLDRHTDTNDYGGLARAPTVTGTLTTEDGSFGLWTPRRRVFIPAAAAGGGNDISAAGALSISGAAALNAAGSLAAAGAVSITGAADLDARGTLNAAGTVSITGAADLDAAGVLVAAGTISIAGAADLDAIGNLAAAGALSISGAADLSGSDIDIVASGSLSITGVAALTAVGQLLAAGSIVVTGAATLDDGQAPEPESPTATESFSGGFVVAYEREVARRRRERKKRQEREEEAERIEEETTREIARLLHEQEAKDARRAELQRLSELVDTYARRGTQATLNDRVEKAIQKAAAKQTVWSLYALERELKRAHEEEEFILSALQFVIDND